MKILHTADLHLKGKEHIPVLESIIQTANKEDVDLIIIAGDLFDTRAKGRELETLLLPVWEQFSGDILVVPGNHDDKYLKNRDYLASNVIVANKTPFAIAKIEDVHFICVPYQTEQSLYEMDIPVLPSSILITHGTYDLNKDHVYFPIHPNDVAGRYDYVALGHYHTWFDKWEKGTLIVNPGAPRQTRRTDRGERYVSVLNTNNWMMERVVLPVSFTEYKTINISISDSEQEIIDKLFNSVKTLLNSSNCRLDISLQGSVFFTEYSVSELLEGWKKALALEGVDVSRIFWHTDKMIQISPNLIYSSFVRVLADKILHDSPKETPELLPFLFERLQQDNQSLL